MANAQGNPALRIKSARTGSIKRLTERFLEFTPSFFSWTFVVSKEYLRLRLTGRFSSFTMKFLALVNWEQVAIGRVPKTKL